MRDLREAVTVARHSNYFEILENGDIFPSEMSELRDKLRGYRSSVDSQSRPKDA
jgi:hypothetical protein